GSASPWGSAGRTPPTSRSARGCAGSCRAGWWAYRWTPTATRRTGWRCRPGNSTSAGRRRPATSAPRRSCWPSSPGCMPPTTGPHGPAAIARGVHGRAAALAATLRAQGATVHSAAFFDTIAVRGLPGGAAAAVERARRAGYNVYLAGPDTVQVACDETTTDGHLREVVAALAGRPPGEVGLAEGREELPAGLLRTSPYLTHPVFPQHRSEPAIARYLP